MFKRSKVFSLQKATAGQTRKQPRLNTQWEVMMMMMMMIHKHGEFKPTEDLEEEALTQQAQDSGIRPASVVNET